MLKQLPLFKYSTSKSHGGSLRKNRRKISRPLDKKRLHHVILKSQHAKGIRSFKNFKMEMLYKKLIFAKAKKYGVHIAKFSNVENHFHLLIRFQNREMVKTFFKVTAGLIARLATGAKKGNKFGKFWDDLIFTRVVSKGLDEARMNDYLNANLIQAEFGDSARSDYEESCRDFWREIILKNKRSKSG